MLRLYYSVISSANQPQPDSRFSLGGFISNSPVSSGQLNAIFDDVSIYSLIQNRKTYLCLIIRNDGDSETIDAELWIERFEEAICKFEFALAQPNSKGEFEAVATIFSKPIYGEFEKANGKEDSITLPDLKPGEMIGLWIERSIDMENEFIKNRNNCDFLYENKDKELSTIESVALKIFWNV